MEHFALEVFDLPTVENPNPTGSQYATLKPNASITITDTSEIFGNGDVWSYSFTLNAKANSHIIGTGEDIHGSRLHKVLNKRKTRLWVDGIPLYTGYLKTGSEVSLNANGDVTVTFESGRKSFDNMIEGGKANQVPLLKDVEIGMALHRSRYDIVRIWYDIVATQNNGDISRYGTSLSSAFYGELEDNSVQEFPRMVFPTGKFISQTDGSVWEENLVNVDQPYTESDNGTPTHPYCNVALCYQQYDYKKKTTSGNVETDYSSEPEAQRGYEYMPANRVNSAPNFFVIYWLRCLMKHLGIYIEENQMMEVEDLRRLFLVNTNCDYEEPVKLKTGTDETVTRRFGKYYWDGGPSWAAGWIIPEVFLPGENIDETKSQLFMENIVFDGPSMKFGIDGLREIDWGYSDILGNNSTDDYVGHNNLFHKAFATSKCFPNVDVSEIINALETGFGVRFLFSNNTSRVRIVLLRNIFNDKNVQTLNAEIVDSDVKVDNNICGFRMTYGKSNDTAFYYKGFADKMTHTKELWKEDSDKHDYSKWNLNADYRNIIKNVSAFDTTCYVTNNNGNAYGIKVQKGVKSFNELYPSVFEYAGFMDAEDGDCSGEEDTIKTVTVGFTPAIMSDVNADEERQEITDVQRFALFVDEKMSPRRFQFSTDYNDPTLVYPTNSLYAQNSSARGMMNGGFVMPGLFAVGADYHVSTKMERDLNVFYNGKNHYHKLSYDLTGVLHVRHFLYLQDNFEPNDDGLSPIETHDWGLTLGIMRGSGKDAHIYEYDDPEDNENSAWGIWPGSNETSHHDTCDSYGRLWDYNGERDGIDDQGNETVTISTPEEAKQLMATLWPYSNFDLTHRSSTDYLTRVYSLNLRGSHRVTIATRTASRVIMDEDKHIPNANNISWPNYYCEYFLYEPGATAQDLFFNDTKGAYVLIDVDGSSERDQLLLDLQLLAYANGPSVTFSIDKVLGTYGRFSLKLRAEKPDPYFDASLGNVVTTKEDAAKAMKCIYKTANTNLLTRPRVSGSLMQAAGWNFATDDYATLYSQGLGVECSDRKVHEILWTPIRENGTVLSPAQLQSYVDGFNGLAKSAIVSKDTEHLILDIDTTEARAETLHQLQELYYADDDTGRRIDISSYRYLPITNKSLRGRGLADQFYKEYSYWVRNARIVKRTVRMTLAQLTTIDKTKRVTVGDVTGFIRKMQFTVSNESGLGNVTIEIMYI